MQYTPYPLTHPQRLEKHFRALYGDDQTADCMERMAMIFGRYGVGRNGPAPERKWSEKDTLLITYGDMVKHSDGTPLSALHQFCSRHLGEAFNHVHILPFFPYSSDDGFSVINYRQVDSELGGWEQVKQFGNDFNLMYDLVLNHVSRQSSWFRHFVSGVAPMRDYFVTAEPNTDLSMVTRPRNHPLLTRTQTRNGERWVWTTFSEDQVDLDFRNPDVLFDFIDILFLYLSTGAKILRLDAIAYLWKVIGTNCIHLPQTHEVVKLLRSILDLVAPDCWLLTETNVPHPENVSYFGDGDEAQIVYQFTLPPLLLHALQTGTSKYLSTWADALAPPPPGCTFLNFTSSHDGIGVRPLEGILPEREIKGMLEAVHARGGFVSTKKNPDGSESPYELNITYFDALSDPLKTDVKTHRKRFLCSQAVALALRGIPAVYFNCLIGTRNDHAGVEQTGRARTINRTKWESSVLDAQLNRKNSHERQVLDAYRHLLKTRRAHEAFHPDGPQKILHAGDACFAVQRTAPGGGEIILSLSNLTSQPQQVSLRDQLDASVGHGPWIDAITNQPMGTGSGQVDLEPYQTAWLVLFTR